MILPSGQKPRVAVCRCECGKIKNVLFLHLVRGRIKSCGCLTGESHGECGTTLYTTWRAMKNRVSPKWKYHQHYYDKGITICRAWLKFTTFKKWAIANGFKPGLLLDRINNSKGYYPNNCRFATDEISVGNRDVTIKVFYKGRERVLSQLCRELGYYESGYNTISARIRRGWDGEEAISTPIREGNYYRGPRNRKTKNLK